MDKQGAACSKQGAACSVISRRAACSVIKVGCDLFSDKKQACGLFLISTRARWACSAISTHPACGLFCDKHPYRVGFFCDKRPARENFVQRLKHAGRVRSQQVSL